jgi:hypothetical protein
MRLFAAFSFSPGFFRPFSERPFLPSLFDLQAAT